MRGPERLLARFRRWDLALSALALAVPTLALMGLGLFWLAQNGHVLEFVLGTAGLAVVLTLPRWLRALLRRWRRRKPGEAPALPPSTIDRPDWTPAEHAAFVQARRLIASRINAPVDWEKLPAIALETIAAAAPRGRELLDFSLPEALLLASTVLGRTRHVLRRNLPFSDQVPLGWMKFLWDRRALLPWLGFAYSWGTRAWRVTTNPLAALAAEVNTTVGGQGMGIVVSEVVASVQAQLLEEVAAAAIDLYSGRLRFSDSELLEIGLAEAGIDRARLAAPDQPLRIVLVGQVSAGKSSLISALTGVDSAATGAAPTTDRLTAHETEIDGMAVTLIDTPGIDDGPANRRLLTEALMEADLVLWVLRANRPGRGADLRLRLAWAQAQAAQPLRRHAPCITVVNQIDRLTPGWPFPEHDIPETAQHALATMGAEIATELGEVSPVLVVAAEPAWGIENLERRIAAEAPAALAAQRARLRLRAEPGMGEEVKRAGRGLVQTGQMLIDQLLRRHAPDER